MARNRKRAKERRAKRPHPVPTARVEPEAETPEPLEHAASNVELADAQIAIGRANVSEDVADDPGPQARAELEDPQEEAAELDEAEFEEEAEEAAEEADTRRALAPRAPVEPEHHATAGNKLINFLRGSWRELQRVQWPDRRQVMQATGVVIGFVIIAGAFLGIADFVAGKVMNYVLTGHFK